MSTQHRFETLYEAHAGSVKAYALRRGADNAADDVVADVFLVAWRRLEEVPEPALPWLLGVARRVLANRRRGEGRTAALRERLRRADAPAAQELAVSGGDGEARVALRSLNAGDRELLTLTAWEGLTVPEIAVALGLRPNTVSVRLHRARRRFAAALAAQEIPAAPQLEARS